MASKKASKSLLSAEAKLAIKAAQWQKKQAEKLYKEKIKEMRPYLKRLKLIDLRKPLKSSDKGLVTKAWKDYQEVTARPFKVYKTKNKKNLKLVQDASQQFTKVKFDVAFVPALKHTRVKIKNGQIIVSSQYTEETKVLFDMKKLAVDPAKEIQRVIDANPGNAVFAIMAGAYLYNGGIPPELIMEKMLPLLARYDNGGEGLAKRGANSHFSNWAFGFRIFKGTRHNISDYMQTYHEEKTKILNAKKRQRQRNTRRYGQK